MNVRLPILATIVAGFTIFVRGCTIIGHRHPSGMTCVTRRRRPGHTHIRANGFRNLRADQSRTELGCQVF